MKEYWVNVYWYPKNKLGPYLSNQFSDKAKAIKFGSKCYNAKRIVLYRIHVKMKPIYIQSYGRINRALTRQQYTDKFGDRLWD